MLCVSEVSQTNHEFGIQVVVEAGWASALVHLLIDVGLQLDLGNTGILVVGYQLCRLGTNLGLE